MFRLPEAIRKIIDHSPPKRQVYVSLALTPSVVQGAVWSMSREGTVEVIGASSQSVAADTWEDRIKASDRIVTALESAAGTESLSEAVLGLSDEYLTDAGDIAPDARGPIRKLLSALGLKALGYVPVGTAIIFHLRRSEGIPPSCILLHVTKRDTDITLYSVGQKIGSRKVKTTETIVKDMEAAIKSIAASEILPSRMLVYGLAGDDLEDFQRMLLKYPWTAKLQFLHFPKIEAIAPELIASAVVTAGASELSQSVGDGQEEAEPEAPAAGAPQPEVVAAAPAAVHAVASHQVVEVVEDEDGEHPVSVTKADEPAVPGEDESSPFPDAGDAAIAAEPQHDQTDTLPGDEDGGEADIEGDLPSQPDVVVVDPASLGFTPVVPPSSRVPVTPARFHSDVTVPDPADDGEDTDADAGMQEEEQPDEDQPFTLKDRILSLVSSVKERFGRGAGDEEADGDDDDQAYGGEEETGDYDSPRPARRFPAALAVAVALAGLVAGAAYWFLPRAAVTLLISPKRIVKTATLTIDMDASSPDPSKNVIPGKKIEKAESGEKTVAASGKKKIGNPAKGTITIYNKFTSSKTLKKGAVFTSGSYQFKLDSDVTIASASETISGTVNGKGTGSLTAAEIGTESNLPANRDFVSKEFGDRIIGQNEQPFTGGTSKDVTVVSRDDQYAILAALKDELVAKAKSDLSGSVTEKYRLIDSTVSVSPQITKTYNREPDEEAKDVTGNVTVTVNGVAYNEDDIKSILSSAVAADVPSGYTLNPTRSTVDISAAQVKKDGTIQVTGSMTGLALPTVNDRELARKTAGKAIADVESVLRTVPGVGSVTIQFSLAPWKTRLPLNAANISFSVSIGE